MANLLPLRLRTSPLNQNPIVQTGAGLQQLQPNGRYVAVTPTGAQAISMKWDQLVAGNAKDPSKVPAWEDLTKEQRGEALRRMGRPAYDVGSVADTGVHNAIDPATGAAVTRTQTGNGYALGGMSDAEKGNMEVLYGKQGDGVKIPTAGYATVVPPTLVANSPAWKPATIGGSAVTAALAPASYQGVSNVTGGGTPASTNPLTTPTASQDTLSISGQNALPQQLENPNFTPIQSVESPTIANPIGATTSQSPTGVQEEIISQGQGAQSSPLDLATQEFMARGGSSRTLNRANVQAGIRPRIDARAQLDRLAVNASDDIRRKWGWGTSGLPY